MNGGPGGPADRVYRVILTVGWLTVALAGLLLVAGLVVGQRALLPGSAGAAQAAALLARIAPWPVLLPLGVVQLVVARRAAAGPGWSRAVAIGTSGVFIAFALLGIRPPAEPSGWFLLAAKLAWLGANGYVIAALLPRRERPQGRA